MTTAAQAIEAIRRALKEPLGSWTQHSGNDPYVWHDDGDSVCHCYNNMGAMPEPVRDSALAAYIAAANPEALRAILDRMAEAEKHEQLWFRIRNLCREQNGIRFQGSDLAGAMSRVLGVSIPTAPDAADRSAG